MSIVEITENSSGSSVDQKSAGDITILNKGEKTMSNQKEKVTNIIKRFLTEPIKTPKEASARIKELTPYLAVSFGAVCVFLILGMLIEPVKVVFNILGFVCMAGVFLFGFCMFRAIQLKKKLANLECTNCKNIIAYDDNVTCEISNQKFSMSEHKSDNQKGGMDVYITGMETVGVNISCKCQQCGTVKTFHHVFMPIRVESKKRMGVPSLNADAVLRDMKVLMQRNYETRFANAGTDYKIKSNMTVDQAVRQYFCDDGTVYSATNGVLTKTAEK